MYSTLIMQLVPCVSYLRLLNLRVHVKAVGLTMITSAALAPCAKLVNRVNSFGHLMMLLLTVCTIRYRKKEL